MTEIGEILVEEKVEEVKVPDYEKFLKSAQVEALQNAGYKDELSIRAASDEELIKLDGIGPATIIKLREWGVIKVEKGDAIAKRFLVLKCGDERLDVRPGDVIPARFGAEEIVESGKATWS